MFILEKNKEGELWLPDNLCRLYNDGFTAYIDFSSHYSYICNKPWSFYIYTFLQTSVVIGANLIPLYMGYQYQKIARLKVLHYLSRFAFIFLIATLVCNIFLRTSWQLEYS